MSKKIKRGFNTKEFGGYHEYRWHGELYVLYDDGTWEVLFEYQWADRDDIHLFNVSRLRGKTKEDVIKKLEADYHAGKIKGVFK